MWLTLRKVSCVKVYKTISELPVSGFLGPDTWRWHLIAFVVWVQHGILVMICLAGLGVGAGLLAHLVQSGSETWHRLCYCPSWQWAFIAFGFVVFPNFNCMAFLISADEETGQIWSLLFVCHPSKKNQQFLVLGPSCCVSGQVCLADTVFLVSVTDIGGGKRKADLLSKLLGGRGKKIMDSRPAWATRDPVSKKDK